MVADHTKYLAEAIVTENQIVRLETSKLGFAQLLTGHLSFA